MKFIIAFLFVMNSAFSYADEIDCNSIDYPNLRISCEAYVANNAKMCSKIDNQMDKDYCLKALKYENKP